MGVVLEKWSNKGQEYLKYMFNVRLAASRGSGTGWAAYDEQYRGTSYLLLQNLKGWSPAQFEHLCAYLHFCPYEHLPLLKFQQDRNPRWVLPFWL
jgi:hypothetical protein